MQSYTGYSFLVWFSFLIQQYVCFIPPCYRIYQQFALFHYCAVFHCKKIHYLFITSTTDGSLDCFQFGTMMNEAAMNTLQVDICRAWVLKAHLWDETISLSKVRKWCIEAHMKPGPSAGLCSWWQCRLGKKSTHKYRVDRRMSSLPLCEIWVGEKSSPGDLGSQPHTSHNFKIKIYTISIP